MSEPFLISSSPGPHPDSPFPFPDKILERIVYALYSHLLPTRSLSNHLIWLQPSSCPQPRPQWLSVCNTALWVCHANSPSLTAPLPGDSSTLPISFHSITGFVAALCPHSHGHHLAPALSALPKSSCSPTASASCVPRVTPTCDSPPPPSWRATAYVLLSVGHSI